MQKYFWWFVRLFYIPERVAKAWGMTHHGRIYGVPAWVRETDCGVDGAPKVPVLVLWCKGVDLLYEAATYFMPSDRYIEAPLKALRPID